MGLMPTFSDFRLGADVVASDGRKVGTLVSVIVDEDGFDPRSLVVRERESFAVVFEPPSLSSSPTRL